MTGQGAGQGQGTGQGTGQGALIRLEAVLADPRFPANLVELTGGARAAFGLPEAVDELGVVCPDVRQAAALLRARFPGMSDYVLGQGSPRAFREEGREQPFTTRLGLGLYRGVLIELSEPGLGSEVFRRSFDGAAAGLAAITVNHVGFFSRGPAFSRAGGSADGGALVDYRERFRRAGAEPHVEAVLNILGLVGKIAIFDVPALSPGIGIEFLDFRMLWRDGPRIPLPRAALGWLGRFQRVIGPEMIRLRELHHIPPPGQPAITG